MTAPSGPDGESLDVLVIGAGQAGLALAWHLKRLGIRHLVVDAGPRIGHTWRSRWDSLRLFSAAEYDSLPGLPFPAPAGTFPSKDQVADYLESYARTFGLPVRLETRVTRLQRSVDGFRADTTTGPVTARQVVVATGAFNQPYVPRGLAEELGPDVVQLHSAEYRRPADLPDGPVLVVGAGNSGIQIAVELASSSRAVSLAVGTRLLAVPQRLLGRDLFWWLTTAGLATTPREAGPAVGRRLRERLVEPAWRRMRACEALLRPRTVDGRSRSLGILIGTSWRSVRASGVSLRPRAMSASGNTIAFADGTSLDVAAVVWATGYRRDHTWLEVPGVVVDRQVVHSNGVTAVPGLSFLGLPHQRSRSSDWLGFVAGDAAWLAEQEIAPNVPSRPSSRAPVQASPSPKPTGRRRVPLVSG